MLPRNSVSSKCTRFALDLILVLLQQKQTNKESKLYNSFHLKTLQEIVNYERHTLCAAINPCMCSNSIRPCSY